MSMKFRTATYNICKGATGIAGRCRVHDVRLALHLIDADLVFLQEVQDRNDRRRPGRSARPAAAQLDYLATSGYSHYAYGINAIYAHGHHGNAILSRYPITSYANHDISDHALERRGMLHAVVEPAGAPPIHLICLHLGLVKVSRLRQARFVADFVEQEIPRDAPLIVAGDFNDWQRRVDTELRGRLAVAEVSDAGEPGLLDRLMPWRQRHPVARTFPSVAPWLRLDRIYVRGLSVRQARVPSGRSWARRSDHVPLIADLELPSPAGG
jgi:endonuclease/exonuclease/phosphatase family metal-dependent hydrolase